MNYRKFWYKDLHSTTDEAEDVLSQRQEEKQRNEKLKERLNASKKVKNEIKESISILDEQDAHPRRPVIKVCR